ncbi:MAG: osmoprotectant transporter permease [Betaproteobacteria bacterium]
MSSIIVYRSFLACSLIVAAIAFVFFAIGLGDGSVSSFNMALWLALLGIVVVVPWAGHALRSRGKARLAIAVLGIVAVPGFLGGLLVLFLLVLQPRWN